MYHLPDAVVAHKLRKLNPRIDDEEVNKILKFAALQRKQDPLLLDATFDQLPQLPPDRRGVDKLGEFTCMGPSHGKVRIPFRITAPVLGQSIDKKWLDGWGAGSLPLHPEEGD